MPVVPTQLLGYAYGGMSQGFSTMYDLTSWKNDNRSVIQKYVMKIYLNAKNT